MPTDKIFAVLARPDGTQWFLAMAFTATDRWPLVGYSPSEVPLLLDTAEQLGSQGQADVRVVEFTITDTLWERHVDA